MKVSLLEDADDERAWDEFVAAHPQATFFHRAGWRRVIGQTYGHGTPFLLARDEGGIRGVLPLVHVRSRLFGDALISTGFCVQGGILAAGTGEQEGRVVPVGPADDATPAGTVEEGRARVGLDEGVPCRFLRVLEQSDLDHRGGASAIRPSSRPA